MLTVLAQGDGYVAVAKPAGRIVVPGRGNAARETPLREELETQLARPLLVVHRLDRGTSGVLLLATDAAAHRALSQAFERHQVVKHYWALVRGRLMGAGVVDVPLIPIRGGLVRPARAGETTGKVSHTAWRALERIGGYTTVDFRPATGRLHQIRAHAAALGHPLAVDPDYGGARLLLADATGAIVSSVDARSEAEVTSADQVILARTPLHALSLKFPEPHTRQPTTVEAPLAEDLQRVVQLLQRGVGAASGPKLPPARAGR